MEAFEAIDSLSELDQPLGRPFAGKRRLANIVDVRMPGTHYRSSVEAGDLRVRPGELLIIENERGLFAAQAEGYAERRLIPAQDSRRALRIATDEDRANHAEQPALTREGLRRAVMLARSKRVDIKFVTLDYTHDRSRVYVYYANDERIDLRHFARDLANTLNSRVELRQVGLREGAGMVGGIGPCGNELCCSSFLRSFESISMKYAKQQGLAIHQQRITGMCGRLKCCLIYEADAYKELKRYAPKNGTGVLTPQGPGELKEFDLISQRGRVRLAGEGSAWFAVADLVLLGRRLTAEEIAAGTSREMQVLNRRRASRGLGSGTSDGAGGERSRAADVEGYLWSDTANAGAEEMLSKASQPDRAPVARACSAAMVARRVRRPAGSRAESAAMVVLRRSPVSPVSGVMVASRVSPVSRASGAMVVRRGRAVSPVSPASVAMVARRHRAVSPASVAMVVRRASPASLVRRCPKAAPALRSQKAESARRAPNPSSPTSMPRAMSLATTPRMIC